MPLLPLIAAAAPAIGAGIQSIFGYRAQRKTNEANMELAKYSYSKDLEMWNRNNAYNSPQAQMARLKGAGLNPALVYGNGAVGNASGTMPKYNAPTLDYSYQPPVNDALAGTLSAFQDFQVKQAQINNLREQNKVIRETGLQKDWANQFAEYTFPYRTGILGTQAQYGDDLARIKFHLQNEKLQQMKGLYPSQLQFQQGKVKYQDSQIINMEKQGRKIDASTDYQNKVNEWYLTKMFSQLGMQAVGKISDFIPGKGIGKAAGTFNQNKRSYQDAKNYEGYMRTRRNSYYSKLKDQGFYD